MNFSTHEWVSPAFRMLIAVAYTHQKMVKEVIRVGFDSIAIIYVSEWFHGLRQLCKPQVLQKQRFRLISFH